MNYCFSRYFYSIRKVYYIDNISSCISTHFSQIHNWTHNLHSNCIFFVIVSSLFAQLTKMALTCNMYWRADEKRPYSQFHCKLEQYTVCSPPPPLYHGSKSLVVIVPLWNKELRVANSNLLVSVAPLTMWPTVSSPARANTLRMAYTAHAHWPSTLSPNTISQYYYPASINRSRVTPLFCSLLMIPFSFLLYWLPCFRLESLDFTSYTCNQFRAYLFWNGIILWWLLIWMVGYLCVFYFYLRHFSNINYTAYYGYNIPLKYCLTNVLNIIMNFIKNLSSWNTQIVDYMSLARSA